MKKILFTASTASHILNFHLPYLKYFKEQGWQVHVVVGDYKEIPFVDYIHVITLKKSVLSVKNFKSIIKLCYILNEEKFEIISTHTALAAFVTRVAKLFARKQSARCINTSHGYLFYKDRNKLVAGIYFLVEYMLALITDDIITMNQSDYDVSKKFFRCKGSVYLIPGMGLKLKNIKLLEGEEKRRKRMELGIDPDKIVLTYIGEFTTRKNQGFLIDKMSELVSVYPDIQLILIGDGIKFTECKRNADTLSGMNKILFTGHIKDVYEYLTITDISVSSSKSEGLPFNIMEAMACGIPVIASKVKGHTDLIREGKNGYLFELDNKDEIIIKIEKLIKDEALRKKIGLTNVNDIQQYALENVFDKIIEIYNS